MTIPNLEVIKVITLMLSRRTWIIIYISLFIVALIIAYGFYKYPNANTPGYYYWIPLAGLLIIYLIVIGFLAIRDLVNYWCKPDYPDLNSMSV